MRKFYANYGPSLGRCCYTRSPFSSSLAAGVRLVVYITRCADCVYLNYLNIYPGYRLFFFALLFFQKRLDAMGDVSDRLWRLWCSGVLRIVYITRAQTTRTSQWVGLFRLNRFRRFLKNHYLSLTFLWIKCILMASGTRLVLSAVSAMQSPLQSWWAHRQSARIHNVMPDSSSKW